MHPYKRLAHKNDPSWLRGVQKYVEKATMDDEKSVVRNYASDPKQTALAGYSIVLPKPSPGATIALSLDQETK